MRAYLRNPEKLFRRVRDEHGQLVLSKAAKAYHPGRGVYRSSYKNARRLASTETNMAYHKADKERWAQLDFIVGFRVEPSKNHPEPDICDDLKGEYPKTFDFSGWHPHCRCHAVPIMKSDDEMMKDNAAILAGAEPSEESENTAKNVPAGFSEWVKLNGARIDAAKSLPYFIRDNKGVVDNILNPQPVKSALDIAKERHAARTPEEKQDLRRAWTLREAKIRHDARNKAEVAARWKVWFDRKATLHYGSNVLNVMDGIADVSTAALSTALKSGNLDAIMAEATKLKSIGKEIYALDNLDKPLQVAKKFSYADAIRVNDAVKSKLAQIAHLLPEEQIKKIEVEVKYVTDPTYLKPHKLYPTSEVAKEAYQKAIKQIELKEAEKIWGKEYAELFVDYKQNTVEAMDKILRAETENIWPSLEKRERYVLTKYTQTYSYLNEPLRGLTYTGERPISEYKEDLPILTGAIAKFQAPKDMIVRRGTKNYLIKSLNKNLNEVEVGDVFSDGGFLSTAAHRDKGFFQPIEMIIAVPKGSQGVFAESFSHYTDTCKFNFETQKLWDGKSKETIRKEFEWIGQRGCEFKVVKRDGNRVYLKLIGQHTKP